MPRDMTEAEFEHFVSESLAGRGRDAAVDVRDRNSRLSQAQGREFVRRITNKAQALDGRPDA